MRFGSIAKKWPADDVATVSRELRMQKQAEAEFRRLNDTLEQRVERLTAELADANIKPSDAVDAALKRAAQPSPDRDMRDAAERLAALSPREREVLDALMAGRPNKVIAFDLGISVRTVEVHRARMMSRLGVRQLAEAIRLAVMAKISHDAA